MMVIEMMVIACVFWFIYQPVSWEFHQQIRTHLILHSGTCAFASDSGEEQRQSVLVWFVSWIWVLSMGPGWAWGLGFMWLEHFDAVNQNTEVASSLDVRHFFGGLMFDGNDCSNLWMCSCWMICLASTICWYCQCDSSISPNLRMSVFGLVQEVMVVGAFCSNTSLLATWRMICQATLVGQHWWTSQSDFLVVYVCVYFLVASVYW